VVGAEGRTGVVVEVTLRLQELACMTPLVAAFDSFEEAERCLVAVVSRAVQQWLGCDEVVVGPAQHELFCLNRRCRGDPRPRQHDEDRVRVTLLRQRARVLSSSWPV
jgi:hypothetical protein